MSERLLPRANAETRLAKNLGRAQTKVSPSPPHLPPLRDTSQASAPSFAPAEAIANSAAAAAGGGPACNTGILLPNKLRGWNHTGTSCKT
eukprot:2720613-Amphidinium_carterae.4